MKDLTSTSFGYVIGFLLPGLLGLYGLGFWSKQADDLLKPIAVTDATLGPSFFLLLSVLTTGLLLSAIRFFLFEKWMCRNWRFPTDMFKQLGTGDKLIAFKAVVDEHYRYHQFYGGCAVALLVLFPKWLWNNWVNFGWMSRTSLIAAFVVFEFLIGVIAKDAFVRYIQRGNAVAGS